MDKLGEMEVFAKVVEQRGFSAAARAMSLTPSGVSKIIARLEDRLKVVLFYRSPRSFSLTPDGEAFYDKVQQVLHAVEDAEQVVSETQEVSGELRVYSLPTFARYQIAPLMPAFFRTYPGLKIEFQLGNDPPRMIDDNIDIAIQSGSLPDSSFISRRISSSRWIVGASPSYLAEFGRPRTPEDLKHHNCLNFSMHTQWNSWPMAGGEISGDTTLELAGNCTSNHGDMLLALARSGTGIVRLAEFHIGEDLLTGRLVPILEDYQDDSEEALYAIFQARRNLSSRVRIFLDFLHDSFARSPPWELS